MTMIIDKKKINKAYIIAFVISYIYILLHFNGSIDAFAPLQIGAIEETINRGYLIDVYRDTIPNFYILGAELAIILGKNSSFLLFSPIQLIPYTILFFVLILKISNSYFLACLLTITELATGFTGSQRIFFWPHGIGSILYFALLILFLLMFNVKNKSTWQHHFAAVIIGISLVFTSYDVIFTYLIFLASFIICTIIFSYPLYLSLGSKDYRRQQSTKLLLLLVIVELGLTDFVYNNFINALKSSESFTLDVLDKFTLSYFSRGLEDSVISDIYIQYPATIAYYGYVKYGILLVFLSLFLFEFISSKRMKYDIGSIFILSIFSSMIIWAIIRIFIGNIEIGFFYYPAIFSIALVYNSKKRLKRWATVAAIILLTLNPVYHAIIYNEDLLNKDTEKYNYLNLPLFWLKEETSGDVRSDELTKNFYHMLSKRQNFQVFNDNDMAFLLNRQSQNLNKYFMINMDLNILSIGNWVQTLSWNKLEDKLIKNSNIPLIFNSEKINIYLNE